MLFGVLIVQREPMTLQELPAALQLWLQSVGSVAAMGLFIWLIAYFAQRRASAIPPSKGVKAPFVFFLALTVICYAALGVLLLGAGFGIRKAVDVLPSGQMNQPTLGDYLLSAGGGFAILAAVVPFVNDLVFRIRFRRVWAIARLSLKEAVRGRVVVVFAAMALIFLFADWFVPYDKPENQVRNYVRVVYWSMMPLFFMTASLLGALSIPNDVRSLSIHTIVTKPVEKFEIVLGRFLGYGTVITLGLVAVASLSLLYVVRGVNPDAEAESFTARVPIFGDLSFFRAKQKDEYSAEATNAGRVWRYRTYIGGSTALNPFAAKPYAVYSFDELPDSLGAGGESVPVEYTFDIFRLTKGRQENEGVYCVITLADGRYTIPKLEAQLDLLRRDRDKRKAEAPPGTNKAELVKRIDQDNIKEFRVYETSAKVEDYHTLAVRVPAALFAAVRDYDREHPRQAAADGSRPPLLQVLVTLDAVSQAQMLGMAKRDLYLLAGNNWFSTNFLKGVVGLWCIFMLVLGVAVACSTYLNGIISWLTTIFLFGAGVFKDFVQQLAEGKLDQGGPAESMYRIVKHTPIAVRLDSGADPTAAVVKGTDAFFRWVMARFLNLIPDVNRFDLHQYVANGFDIPLLRVLVLDNLLPLGAYLLPWAVLAYYLMKSREIANPT